MSDDSDSSVGDVPLPPSPPPDDDDLEKIPIPATPPPLDEIPMPEGNGGVPVIPDDEIPLPPDSSKYSPSQATGDDDMQMSPSYEISSSGGNNHSTDATVSSSSGPMTTSQSVKKVLDKAQAKKRLMAFSAQKLQMANAAKKSPVKGVTVFNPKEKKGSSSEPLMIESIKQEETKFKEMVAVNIMLSEKLKTISGRTSAPITAIVNPTIMSVTESNISGVGDKTDGSSDAAIMKPPSSVTKHLRKRSNSESVSPPRRSRSHSPRKDKERKGSDSRDRESSSGRSRKRSRSRDRERDRESSKRARRSRSRDHDRHQRSSRERKHRSSSRSKSDSRSKSRRSKSPTKRKRSRSRERKRSRSRSSSSRRTSKSKSKRSRSRSPRKSKRSTSPEAKVSPSPVKEKVKETESRRRSRSKSFEDGKSASRSPSPRKTNSKRSRSKSLEDHGRSSSKSPSKSRKSPSRSPSVKKEKEKEKTKSRKESKEEHKKKSRKSRSRSIEDDKESRRRKIEEEERVINKQRDKVRSARFPVNWTEYFEYQYSLDHIKNLHLKNAEQKYRKRGRSHSPSPGKRDSKDTGKESRSKSLIDLTSKECPLFITRKTQAAPPVSYGVNPSFFPGYFKAQRDVFRVEEPEICDFMIEIMKAYGVDDLPTTMKKARKEKEGSISQERLEKKVLISHLYSEDEADSSVHNSPKKLPEDSEKSEHDSMDSVPSPLLKKRYEERSRSRETETSSKHPEPVEPEEWVEKERRGQSLSGSSTDDHSVKEIIPKKTETKKKVSKPEESEDEYMEMETDEFPLEKESGSSKQKDKKKDVSVDEIKIKSKDKEEKKKKQKKKKRKKTKKSGKEKHYSSDSDDEKEEKSKSGKTKNKTEKNSSDKSEKKVKLAVNSKRKRGKRNKSKRSESSDSSSSSEDSDASKKRASKKPKLQEKSTVVEKSRPSKDIKEKEKLEKGKAEIKDSKSKDDKKSKKKSKRKKEESKRKKKHKKHAKVSSDSSDSKSDSSDSGSSSESDESDSGNEKRHKKDKEKKSKVRNKEKKRAKSPSISPSSSSEEEEEDEEEDKKKKSKSDDRNSRKDDRDHNGHGGGGDSRSSRGDRDGDKRHKEKDRDRDRRDDSSSKKSRGDSGRRNSDSSGRRRHELYCPWEENEEECDDELPSSPSAFMPIKLQLPFNVSKTDFGENQAHVVLSEVDDDPLLRSVLNNESLSAEALLKNITSRGEEANEQSSAPVRKQSTITNPSNWSDDSQEGDSLKNDFDSRSSSLGALQDSGKLTVPTIQSIFSNVMSSSGIDVTPLSSSGYSSGLSEHKKPTSSSSSNSSSDSDSDSSSSDSSSSSTSSSESDSSSGSDSSSQERGSEQLSSSSAAETHHNSYEKVMSEIAAVEKSLMGHVLEEISNVDVSLDRTDVTAGYSSELHHYSPAASSECDNSTSLKMPTSQSYPESPRESKEPQKKPLEPEFRDDENFHHRDRHSRQSDKYHHGGRDHDRFSPSEYDHHHHRKHRHHRREDNDRSYRRRRHRMRRSRSSSRSRSRSRSDSRSPSPRRFGHGRRSRHSHRYSSGSGSDRRSSRRSSHDYPEDTEHHFYKMDRGDRHHHHHHHHSSRFDKENHQLDHESPPLQSNVADSTISDAELAANNPQTPAYFPYPPPPLYAPGGGEYPPMYQYPMPFPPPGPPPSAHPPVGPVGDMGIPPTASQEEGNGFDCGSPPRRLSLDERLEMEMGIKLEPSQKKWTGYPAGQGPYYQGSQFHPAGNQMYSHTQNMTATYQTSGPQEMSKAACQSLNDSATKNPLAAHQQRQQCQIVQLGNFLQVLPNQIPNGSFTIHAKVEVIQNQAEKKKEAPESERRVVTIKVPVVPFAMPIAEPAPIEENVETPKKPKESRKKKREKLKHRRKPSSTKIKSSSSTISKSDGVTNEVTTKVEDDVVNKDSKDVLPSEETSVEKIDDGMELEKGQEGSPMETTSKNTSPEDIGSTVSQNQEDATSDKVLENSDAIEIKAQEVGDENAEKENFVPYIVTLPLPEPEKGILVSAGFRERRVDESQAKQKKGVKFVDGVNPGYGTESSDNEEMKSPPPPTILEMEKKKLKKLKLKAAKRREKAKKKMEERRAAEKDTTVPPPPSSPFPFCHPGILYQVCPQYAVLYAQVLAEKGFDIVFEETRQIPSNAETIEMETPSMEVEESKAPIVEPEPLAPGTEDEELSTPVLCEEEPGTSPEDSEFLRISFKDNVPSECKPSSALIEIIPSDDIDLVPPGTEKLSTPSSTGSPIPTLIRRTRSSPPNVFPSATVLPETDMEGNSLLY